MRGCFIKTPCRADHRSLWSATLAQHKADDTKRSSAPLEDTSDSEDAVEKLPRLLPDLAQLQIQPLIVQLIGSPPSNQFRQHFRLRRRRGQMASRVTARNAQPVIDGTIEHRGVAQKVRILALQVPHLLDDVDARGRVQHLVEYPGAPQPEIHQGEVDIVEAAYGRLQRIARSLLLLQPRAHLRQFFARPSALSVAPPIDLL